MAMATPTFPPDDQTGNPTITEIELADITFVTHRALNAVELTVVDSSGAGYRTWLGDALEAWQPVAPQASAADAVEAAQESADSINPSCFA
jgi:hypothetical protein